MALTSPLNKLIIFNTTLPQIVILDPGPQNIRINASKVYNRTRTLGGWIFEHWGENPEVMAVNGITRAMTKDRSLLVETAFFTLKQIYKLDKRQMSALYPRLKDALKINDIKKEGLTQEELAKLSNTYIYYNYNLYSGFFTNFNWSQDATRPFIYIYDFQFLVTGTTEDYLRDKIVSLTGTTGAIANTILSLGSVTGGTITSIKKLK